MKQIFFIFLILSGYNSLAGSDPSLQITNAWIQEGPPNARVLAGFMDINNHTTQGIIIESATSDSFKRIEFHQTINENGMARMRKQDKLMIKSGASLKLKHGGYHLMLIQPKKHLKEGDKIDILFKLSTSTTQLISLTVKKPTDSQQGHQHHH